MKIRENISKEDSALHLLLQVVFLEFLSASGPSGKIFCQSRRTPP
jgi:hypothetical protein